MVILAIASSLLIRFDLLYITERLTGMARLLKRVGEGDNGELLACVIEVRHLETKRRPWCERVVAHVDWLSDKYH